MMTTPLVLATALSLLLLLPYSTSGADEVRCDKGEKKYKDFHDWATCANKGKALMTFDGISGTDTCEDVDKTQGLCAFLLLVTDKTSGALTGTRACLTVADMDKYKHNPDPEKQGKTNVFREKEGIGIIVSFKPGNPPKDNEVDPRAVTQLKETLSEKNITLGNDKCGGGGGGGGGDGKKSGAGTVQLNNLVGILVFAAGVTAFAASLFKI